jgi:hypothetical protein
MPVLVPVGFSKIGVKMDQQLPPWSDDPLSTFFRDTEYNERASSLNFARIYVVLQKVHVTFQELEKAVAKDNRVELERLVPRFLAIRTHSSFLAGIRLAMSGQLPESYAVLRSAIEQAWYALHIAKDTNPPNRAKVWLARDNNKDSKSKCRKEFAVGKVRSTHELFDCSTAMQLHELYDRTIDFGGHPNEKSLFGAMSRVETANEIIYSVGILSFRDPVLVVAALHMAVAVAIGTLKVFELIFQERFLILGLDAKVLALVRDLNAVFKQYIPKS